ncbi:hypothetical protein Smp_059400 [Schistosoma mansoni]|uniref:hypothetical protein n=1 Tax=Schistosoma mansoni TaxID=6183 RepID=UPI0001A6425B|nr:hypothetical protein Smp_059400 [Schistosoma mansoni]|eukprot:XP_018651730.1 hypothetical protein Smp_059400 [Schistosoma mansoni]
MIRQNLGYWPFESTMKQESWTHLSSLLPIFTDHFSKRFIQRNKKLEHDISLPHFNNIHNNDIDVTDTLSCTYHWTNDYKDIYHANKRNFHFDASNELEMNEPESC